MIARNENHRYNDTIKRYRRFSNIEVASRILSFISCYFARNSWT